MSPHDVLLTRSQVAERVGVSEDVLGFWIKNGLLVATQGGAGRGSHRRFDVFQVNIAAVLVELRKFGVNVSAMRLLAGMLQRGNEIMKGAACNFWALFDAQDLANRLHAFRSGRDVVVDPDPEETERLHPGFDLPAKQISAWMDTRERPAQSEDEIIAYQRACQDSLYDDVEKIIATAVRLKPEDRLPLDLFQQLNHIAFRFVSDNGDGSDLTSDWGDFEWLIVPPIEDLPHEPTRPVEGDAPEVIERHAEWARDMERKFALEVYTAPEGHDLLGRDAGKVRSGLFLAPGTIARSVWGDDLRPILIHEIKRPPGVLARRRMAREEHEAIKERLRRLPPSG